MLDYLNTNNNIIYIYISIEETNSQKQKRQNKRKKSERRLSQSTNSYKIYCGVEYSRAWCLKKSKRIFFLKL